MTVNLNSPEFQRDPYKVYSHLRIHDPIATTRLSSAGATLFLSGSQKSDVLFLTRYQDAVSVLKDARFSNEYAKVSGGIGILDRWWVPGILRAFAKNMAMVDDPTHTRLRNLVHKGFTPRMIHQMETRIYEISHALLDKAMEKPAVDLITDFANPLPMTVISELMGVPSQQRGIFQKDMAKFIEALSGMNLTTSLLKVLPSIIGLNRFFREMIALRKRNPQNDLITLLVQAEEQGDKLSEDELVAMLFLLLLAGHETTVNLIGNGTLALLQHPEQLEKLITTPELMDSAVEEMLRFTSPVHQIASRFALEDIDLKGHVVRKGSTVLIGIASANHDESVFKDAHVFDITRTPNRHIAFGLGIHYCLGAPLARMEAKIAFGTLLSRFPDMRLAVPEGQLQWRGGLQFRGLRHLPLHFGAQSQAIPA